MIMTEVKALEEALEKEGRIQQRQALLKRLWKARQGLTEQQHPASSPATNQDQAGPRATVRRAG
jgi:hypothetical protein